MGELKEIYHAQEDHRAVFKSATQHYLYIRKRQVALKQKIKATFRRWGVFRVEGHSIYHAEGRKAFLDRLAHKAVRGQLLNLYQLLDTTLQAQKEAKRQLTRLGGRYEEIKEFQKIPGIGPIGAHLFDAFIQTPYRFKTRQKLWRYCQLGIRSRTSDGKPLGYEELDPTGRSELKALSYRAWLTALRTENEVHTFYEQSLRRTRNTIHARLNTQRKILATLLSLWKNKSAYIADKFLGSK